MSATAKIGLIMISGLGLWLYFLVSSSEDTRAYLAFLPLMAGYALLWGAAFNLACRLYNKEMLVRLWPFWVIGATALLVTSAWMLKEASSTTLIPVILIAVVIVVDSFLVNRPPRALPA